MLAKVEVGALEYPRRSQGVVSEQKPEPEDWFGENVKDSVSNDFTVDTQDVSSVSNTPDAMWC